MRLPDFQVVRIVKSDCGPSHQVLMQGVFNSRWQWTEDKGGKRGCPRGIDAGPAALLISAYGSQFAANFCG